MDTLSGRSLGSGGWACPVYGAAVHGGDSSILCGGYHSSPAGRPNGGRNRAKYVDLRGISTGQKLAQPHVLPRLVVLPLYRISKPLDPASRASVEVN